MTACVRLEKRSSSSRVSGVIRTVYYKMCAPPQQCNISAYACACANRDMHTCIEKAYAVKCC
eukprot:8377-Heterococcus_DN1.PRE.3